MHEKIKKSNKKNIKLLNRAKFREPFQILVDDTFISNMNKYGKKYKHLKDIFKCEPKLFFTNCILNKHKQVSTVFENDLSDYCELIKCPHKEKSDVLKCLSFVFRKYNKNHYIIGTSSKQVMEKYKERKDTPLLNFAKGQIRLFFFVDKAVSSTHQKFLATEKELERLEQIFGEGNDKVVSVSEEFEQVDIANLEISEEEISA